MLGHAMRDNHQTGEILDAVKVGVLTASLDVWKKRKENRHELQVERYKTVYGSMAHDAYHWLVSQHLIPRMLTPPDLVQSAVHGAREQVLTLRGQDTTKFFQHLMPQVRIREMRDAL